METSDAPASSNAQNENSAAVDCCPLPLMERRPANAMRTTDGHQTAAFPSEWQKPRERALQRLPGERR